MEQAGKSCYEKGLFCKHYRIYLVTGKNSSAYRIALLVPFSTIAMHCMVKKKSYPTANGFWPHFSPLRQHSNFLRRIANMSIAGGTLGAEKYSAKT